jgi:hypothetical protein
VCFNNDIESHAPRDAERRKRIAEKTFVSFVSIVVTT